MSAAEIFNIADRQKITTKLVCSACGAAGQGSCGCGASYVPWKEKAAADAVAKNPEKSNRAIAEEIGADEKTVRKAREKSTADQSAVEKRTGKDGKTRKMPKTRGTGKTADKYQKTRAAVRDPIAAGRDINTKDIAKAQGVSVDTVERAALAEQARVDVLNELSVDPTTLALSAQAKLETAKRMMERQLRAEHVARMRGLDEEVRQRVLKETKEYLVMLKAREKEAELIIARYKEFINNHKPLYTVDEWQTIRMCVHSDGERTVEKCNEAFRLINEKKFQLTGKE